MLSNDLRVFVAEELRIPGERLRPTDRLQNELGLDGDDAEEFIKKFAARFAVDMTRFTFADYFAPEAAGCISLWIVWLFIPPLRPKVTPISLSDLQRTIDAKRWLKIRPPRGKRKH